VRGARCSRAIRAPRTWQGGSRHRALTKARLEKEHARLLSYQDRKDLKIEDLMAITTRLSEIEAGVEQAKQGFRAAASAHRYQTMHFDTTSASAAAARSAGAERIGQHPQHQHCVPDPRRRRAAAGGVLALIAAWGVRRGGVAAAALPPNP
jgi:hypothetical protein